MVKYFVSCFIYVLLYSSTLSAQERTFSTIEETVNYHIEELTSNIGQYDNIFVLIGLDSSVNLPGRVLKVNYFLDAKLLDKRAKNFVVRFLVSSTKEFIQIQAINFQVIKASQKKIKWLNLGSGRNYRIVNSS